MIVLGVDPGKMTGAMVWSEREVLHHGQCGSFEFLAWAEQAIPVYAPWGLHVVCEKFDIGPDTLTKAKDVHWATDVIGTLWYWCTRYDVPFKRSPRSAKSFSSDDKLKALGWYKPTPGGHANDAARHVLAYLVDTRSISLKGLETRATQK